MTKFSLLVLVPVLSSVAWADVAPRDRGGCEGKTEGVACKRDDGSDASCVKSTCSRNDYSNGPPPTSVSYDCLLCTGAAPVKKQSCSAVPGEALLGVLGLLMLRRR